MPLAEQNLRVCHFMHLGTLRITFRPQLGRGGAGQNPDYPSLLDHAQGEPLLKVTKTRKWPIAKAELTEQPGPQPSYVAIRD